jgi:hypothetical protein
MASEIETTAIVTGDTSVATGYRILKWLFVSAGATGGSFQINDSTDDSGTDKIDIAMPASTTLSMPMLNLTLKLGLYVDVPGTNITVNLGYS